MATLYVNMAATSFLAFSCIIVYILVLPVTGQTYDQNMQLTADKLNGYDRRLRPVLNQSKPIDVNVSFGIMSLRDVDEVQEIFSVTGFFRMEWFDEKLTWDPTAYGGIESQVYKIVDIWYPILVLTNPSKEMEDIAQDWMTIRVESNGLATFFPGSIFEATCSIDVTYFPFDIQTCSLEFIPWGTKESEMVLRSHLDTILQISSRKMESGHSSS